MHNETVVMEDTLESILEKYVISFIGKTKDGYMVAVVDKDEYGTDDYQQKHFTGSSLEQVLSQVLES